MTPAAAAATEIRESKEARAEVADLLRRLATCDTSNPTGRESRAAAILEDYLLDAGPECERVARDPERASLIAHLSGTGKRGWCRRWATGSATVT